MKNEFKKGQKVKVSNGPFVFNGVVEDLRYNTLHECYQYLVRGDEDVFPEWRYENQLTAIY
jgi:transcription antitermination factor NusG